MAQYRETLTASKPSEICIYRNFVKVAATQSMFLKYTLIIVFPTGFSILQKRLIVLINLKDYKCEIEFYSSSGGNDVKGVLTEATRQ